LVSIQAIAPLCTASVQQQNGFAAELFMDFADLRIAAPILTTYNIGCMQPVQT
jgi:hypothetical protein